MPKQPTPGQAVRGSTTGRPIMAALDLLGRRWSLRIVWELRDGPLGARALRSMCDGMSSSVLYQRLAEMAAADLITKNTNGDYELTQIGSELGPALTSLMKWSDNWAASIYPQRSQVQK